MPEAVPNIGDPTLEATRWDRFFLRIARECAGMSKDPSTQVGSVIVRPNKTIVSTGWNGFARGLNDAITLYADRDFKMKTVVHAEANALMMARESLEDYTLYTSGLPPCPSCAALIIQSGVERVVTERADIPERWIDDIRLSITQMLRTGIAVNFIDMQTGWRYEAFRQPKHATNGIALYREGFKDLAMVI